MEWLGAALAPSFRMLTRACSVSAQFYGPMFPSNLQTPCHASELAVLCLYTAAMGRISRARTNDATQPGERAQACQRPREGLPKSVIARSAATRQSIRVGLVLKMDCFARLAITDLDLCSARLAPACHSSPDQGGQTRQPKRPQTPARGPPCKRRQPRAALHFSL